MCWLHRCVTQSDISAITSRYIQISLTVFAFIRKHSPCILKIDGVVKLIELRWVDSSKKAVILAGGNTCSQYS